MSCLSAIDGIIHSDLYPYVVYKYFLFFCEARLYQVDFLMFLSDLYSVLDTLNPLSHCIFVCFIFEAYLFLDTVDRFFSLFIQVL